MKSSCFTVFQVLGFEVQWSFCYSSCLSYHPLLVYVLMPCFFTLAVWQLFFASFFSRDEAYRLIIDGWSQNGTSDMTRCEHQVLLLLLISCHNYIPAAWIQFMNAFIVSSGCSTSGVKIWYQHPRKHAWFIWKIQEHQTTMWWLEFCG